MKFKVPPSQLAWLTGIWIVAGFVIAWLTLPDGDPVLGYMALALAICGVLVWLDVKAVSWPLMFYLAFVIFCCGLFIVLRGPSVRLIIALGMSIGAVFELNKWRQQKESPSVLGSPLQQAIARGMQADGDLADELRELGDYVVHSREDAKAICAALGELPDAYDLGDDLFITSPLWALSSLFQDVENAEAPAFAVLYHQGLPELIRIFDELSEAPHDLREDDLLFVLKILAMYGSREGAEKVVEAAKRPLFPDAYLWHVVLGVFSDEHPQSNYVFESLTDPPPGFLAIALLDSANAAAIAGWLSRHPFDSDAGRERLEAWLTDSDPEHASYAHSATAALPFISNPDRDQLLALALDHVNSSVQIEAAWAAAKLGREAGLKILARYCQDVRHAGVAIRYLDELGREEFIPAEALEESFQAKAAFSLWLSHPNELGQPPDELEIVDHRLLAWPPERIAKPFWLIRFRLRDRTGLEEDQVDCGLVGSMTWCFFAYEMHKRPPEDAYAIHCYWEMEQEALILESEVENPAEHAHLVEQWRGEPLESAEVRRIAEISPQLESPSRLVALASATMRGEAGSVVLDGPRSAWYPKSGQYGDGFGSVVLKIHVGRQLLGFDE